MPKFYFEDFFPGQVMEFGPHRVTREEIIDFAGQFDPQPMHLDDEAAKATLLGGLAASGWHSCAMLMRMACDGFVVDSASMGAPGVDEVRWLKPVKPDDLLTLRLTIRETRGSKSRPQMGFVVMFYEMLNQDGVCVMTLQTPMMMARRAPAASGVAS